jgi:hypothetical protein
MESLDTHESLESLDTHIYLKDFLAQSMSCSLVRVQGDILWVIREACVSLKAKT